MKLELIEQAYEKLDPVAARRFELAAQDTFAFWSRKTFVKVIFLYCRNRMNKRLGRQGRVANYTRGGRIATRNLDLIPAIDHPAGRRAEAQLYRYYDISRANAVRLKDGTSQGLQADPDLSSPPVQGQWRAMHRDRITVVTAYWDLTKNIWVPLQ